MESCIFCKIRDGEIPKEFTYQDEHVMVFPDIHPLKPVHLLVVPKEHIGDFLNLKDNALSNHLRDVVRKMVKEQKLENKGYRVTINGGGYQIVDHLHIHILGPLGTNQKI